MINHYDIGMVCMMNYNIGNNLTNYALYCYMKAKGYHVKLIPMPYDLGVTKYYEKKGTPLYFQKIPYEKQDILRAADKWELYAQAENCGAYMTASDQLWRDYFVKQTDYFAMLDWVPSYKYKFSYATSVGTDVYRQKENEEYHSGFLLNRFNKISVREQSAKALLMDKWQIDVQVVTDPVFLCDISYYDILAQRGMKRLVKDTYTAMYFLDASKIKETAGLEIAQNITGGRYMAMTEIVYRKMQSDCIEYTLQPYVEEWLAMIKNSDFVVTDSFHGMCFAILYQKPFCVIFDKKSVRGYARFTDLLGALGLEDRLLDVDEKLNLDDEKMYTLDYSRVNKILGQLKRESEDWLASVFAEMKNYRGKDDAYGCYLYSEYLRQKNEKKQQALFTAQSDKVRELSLKQSGGTLEHTEIVGWGIGNCFRKNKDKIMDKCAMKYICDSNPDNWGKEIIAGVECISPQELYKMDKTFVIIIAENIAIIEEIEKELQYMGITDYISIDEWFNEADNEK